MLSLAMPVSAQPPWLGLDPISAYTQTDGHCGDCGLSAVTSWYFTGEQVALPRKSSSDPAYMPTWLDDLPLANTVAPVWLGSPDYLKHVRLTSADPIILMQEDRRIPARLVRQHPRNRDFYNNETQRFFQQRALNARGRFNWGQFEIHSLWPTDYRLTAEKTEPLSQQQSLKNWVQHDIEDFKSRLIWQRDAQTSKADQTVIGLMLNGAQGDNHAALAGHFALVTGRLQADGRFDHWLVNNFYNLDSYNEKAILAAPTPMDKYLADLNSGQNYYRPSYMLVAVLDDDQIARGLQQSLNQLFGHFYHHHLVYDHAQANCAGLSLDILKAAGFNIPSRGNEGMVKATGAYFYTLFTQQSFQDAQQIYDYMTEERTRLLPAQTFDAVGERWLELIEQTSPSKLSETEKKLQSALQSMWLVKIPQFPSSRAVGSAPVYSIDEYRQRTPDERADWQSSESIARPFPERFNTAPAVNSPPSMPVPMPVAVVISVLVVGVWLIIYGLRRRLQRR